MRFLRTYGIELALVVSLGFAVLFFGYLAVGLLPRDEVNQEFSGSRALEDAGRQIAFGARITGTSANVQMGEWLIQQLVSLGWDVVIQEFNIGPALKGRNIIAVRSPDGASSAPVILLTTHYDTRLVADADPVEANRTRPAPGANNGASGTAVLLELARTLDVDAAGHTVCLGFFDGDANVGLPGWEGRAGSRHFALTASRDISQCASPQAVVSLDMVGGENPRFVRAATASNALQNAIWQVAAQLGFAEEFVDQERDPVDGGHLPFAEQGIPAALIADSTFTGGATLADTVDRLRASTLDHVGRTLEAWLEGLGSGE